jgi:hypothetical protein
MSAQPIPGLAATLRDGRDYVLDAVGGVSEEQARNKPAPDRWSILDCMEHLVVAEGRFQGWVHNGRDTAPGKDVDREIRLFHMVSDRSFKAQSPEGALPTGRYATLAEAVSEFQKVRTASMDLAADLGTGLYSIGVTHPRLGDMNGSDLMNILTAHARRHADQIREVRETLGI